MMQSAPLSRAATAQHAWALGGMRSPAGALGALAVLLAVPMEVLGQLLGVREGILVHVFLGIGTLLVAYAAFQFGLPRWLAWAGFLVATALALIFLLQALTELTMSESLRGLGYGILGQWPEGMLGELIMLWFLAPLGLASRGRTRRLGVLILPSVIALALLRSLPGLPLGGGVPAILLLLIAYTWILFASAQSAAGPRE
jgi:hypothetical protein